MVPKNVDRSRLTDQSLAWGLSLSLKCLLCELCEIVVTEQDGGRQREARPSVEADDAVDSTCALPDTTDKRRCARQTDTLSARWRTRTADSCLLSSVWDTSSSSLHNTRDLCYTISPVRHRPTAGITCHVTTLLLWTHHALSKRFGITNPPRNITYYIFWNVKLIIAKFYFLRNHSTNAQAYTNDNGGVTNLHITKTDFSFSLL